MSAVNARAPTKPSAGDPMQDFIASLEAASRHASRLEKLPRKRLLDELSAARGANANAKSLLRHIQVLTHRFEQLAQTLQDNEAERIAEAAQRKGAERLEQRVRQQSLLEPAELSARLGWTRQALSKALAARRIFFVEVKGARYYPSFFADDRYERRHVEAVSKLLGDLPGASKLLFMTTPKASLEGLTPLQALEQGRPLPVKAAAESFAQR